MNPFRARKIRRKAMMEVAARYAQDLADYLAATRLRAEETDQMNADLRVEDEEDYSLHD